MTSNTRLVSFDQVRAASERLTDVAHRTPLEDSRHASTLAGGQVLLKCEHLQRTGSFKIRGAYNRIARLSAEERDRGVVAASAGNHAQGVALAATEQGVESVVVMPANAPIPKVAATRSYGARVQFVEGAVDDCLVVAQQLAEDEGRVFVHPFDHPDVVAGQGTLGLELAEQAPDLRTVLVPIGGGGLVAGMAVALRHLLPDIRIIGVQASGASSVLPSLDAGEPRALDEMDTMADGIAVRRPGALTLPHIAELVDEVVTVDDAVTSRAVLLLLERAKQLVEPAGAVGIGALIAGAVEVEAPTAVILSGGNIDPLVLRTMITVGLAEERRYVAILVRVDDTPGSLARVLQQVADLRANVVTVEHHRLRGWRSLGTVEVMLELETRGVDHAHEIVATLRDHGYDVEED